MNLSILAFRIQRDRFPELISTLEAFGSSIDHASTLTGLHRKMACTQFDAVLVRNRTLCMFCMKPIQHLWRYRSPAAIITLEMRQNGTPRARLYMLPGETEEEMRARKEKKKALGALLASCLFPLDKPLAEESTLINDLSGSGISLHPKLSQIALLIEKAGQSGITADDIERMIWKQDKKCRKKNVQVYICKLRKVLTKTRKRQWDLAFKNNRYRLSSSERA